MTIRAFSLAVLVPAALAAQSQSPPTPPQVTTSATAEVELKPDRATLVFSVESRGANAASAGAETARKQLGVLDTLRRLGVAADQMTTASIQINPEYVYPGENKPPRVAAYVARNALRVEVLKIDLTGELIDAALAKGASGIGSLEFSSTKRDDARRQAMEMAVASAKGEAEAMARAAGGSLGGLIELVAQPADRQFPAPMEGVRLMNSAAAAPMPVNPGLLGVSATVMGRWRFAAK